MKLYLLLFSVLFCSSTPLRASCCASGASSGIPRLLPFERGLIEISQDIRSPIGYFDERRAWHGERKYRAHPFLLHYEVQAMARLLPFFLPFVKIPFRTTIGVDGIGNGLSDIQLGARWPLLSEHFWPHWPGITLLTTAQIPTGKNKETTPVINSEDIMGTGATALTLGVLFERSFSSLLLSLGYSYTMEPRIFLKRDIAHGGRHVPTISAMLPVALGHGLSLSLSATFEEPLHVDGKRIRHTEKQKFSSALTYMWKFHSHLSLTSSAGADIPLFGKNESTELSLRIGLRVGVF